MTAAKRTYARTLARYYGFYVGGFLAFVLALAVAESMGMPDAWIGWIFMGATVALYAGIGILSRTADVSEYYVAGRRVPALFNGMATGADWMSAASFIGLAGTLYLKGYDGLAFVMGWTGGYVLVALFLAPYLRKFNQYTLPDFIGARYGGNLARSIAVAGVILASFTYVTAQIYGVGLITSRFLGIAFETGVYVGLAGILFCALLGGMRAVTWTQVAQYVILLIAYLTPVVFLSYQVTGVPVPQVVYGSVLEKLAARENELFAQPGEAEVHALFRQRQAALEAKVAGLKAGDLALYDAERRAVHRQLEDALAGGNAQKIGWARKAVDEFPADVPGLIARLEKALEAVQAQTANPPHHAEAFPAQDTAARQQARANFLALAFCLMVGTAALPHLLMRYYTTPGVSQARSSVFWSLLFISLLYLTAPAYAVFAKYEVYTHVVGADFSELPAWVESWARVGMVRAEDINVDGILQLAELTLHPDVIVLATPEIAGLPHVVVGLVAAGALAAALSTADGLLLTIANVLSHDVYYRMLDPKASTGRRLGVSRGLLLLVALIAAWAASLKPDTLPSMVAWAFSIAGACFFPALVLGIFWKRATRAGAVTGMLVGLGLTLAYLVGVKFYAMGMWFGITDVSAGIFGIPAGFLTIIVVSLLTRPPDEQTRELVEHVRYPNLRGEAGEEAAVQ